MKQNHHDIELRRKLRRLALTGILVFAGILISGLLLLISAMFQWTTLHTISQAALTTLSIGIGIGCIKRASDGRKSENWKYPDYRRITYLIYSAAALNFLIAFMTIYGWDVIFK